MHPSATDPHRDEPVTDLSHDNAPVRTPRNHRAHGRKFRLPVRANVVCRSLIWMNPCAEGRDAPIVTTSGLSGPKLLRGRFIAAIELSACLGDSGQEGGV